MDKSTKGASQVTSEDQLHNIINGYKLSVEAKDQRIAELEKSLDKLINRAQQVDSWESFPDSWLDEAYEALKVGK